MEHPAMARQASPEHATAPASTEQPYERTSGPIHQYFGLTYANFLVIHRARLQSMPLEWQQRCTVLLEELQAAYATQPETDFEVTTVIDHYVEDLTAAEMQVLGITAEDPDEDPGGVPSYTDRHGNRLDGGSHVGVPIPDPVPHYRRAYLPPDEDAIAALRAARRQSAGRSW
jgi:hypothetical protein